MIAANLILLASACFGQFFERNTVPTVSETPHVLMVNSGYDATGDLLVIDGYNASLYENFNLANKRSVELPNNCTAVDFADIDSDGRSELLIVSGAQVMRIDLAPETSPTPGLLFESPNIFEKYTGEPFPHVMHVQKEDINAIALPTQDELRVYDAQGTVLERFPIGANAPYLVSIGRPFSATPMRQNRAAPKASPEFMVQQTLAVKLDLPQDWLPTSLPIPAQRKGTLSQMADAATQPPATWPWFPLNEETPQGERVLYAVEGNGGERRTLIRMRRNAKAGDVEARYTEAKLYPGQIIQPEKTPPDFNNDGYSDFITWQSPTPTPSVNVLSKMLGGGTWPFYLQAYLYSPEAETYHSKAGGHITLEMSLEEILAIGPQSPFGNVIMEDMNHDGKSDIAFTLGDATFMLWLHTPSGFPKTPNESYVVSTPIGNVAYHGATNAAGDYAVVLRAGKTLHLLTHTAAKK